MKKLHIASIVPDTLSTPASGLGVQFNILHRYLKDEFEYTVYGRPDKHAPDFVRCVTPPLPHILHFGINNLLTQSEYVAQIVAQNPKPDIVHATDHTVYFAGIQAARILNVPLVVSLQLSPSFIAKLGHFNAFDPRGVDGRAIINAYLGIEMLGFEKADAVIHNSLVYKTHFDQNEIHKSKSVHIPNGAEHDVYKIHNPVSLPGNARRKVVFLGRLSFEKNVLTLLASHIPSEIDLYFICNIESAAPEYQTALRQKMQANKNVHYLGPVFGQKKIDILHAVDAVILPSEEECHPLVLHEALISKCIFISGFVGDIANVISRDVGIDCGLTPQSISNALQVFATMDEAEIHRRKEAGFLIEQKYDFKNLAQEYAKIYRHVTSK